jgi:hypothetical protein
MTKTPSIRLDKSRKHSSVHGEVSHGLAYVQDGLPFNQMGELIEALVTPELKPVVEAKTKRLKKAAAPAETEQVPPVPEAEGGEGGEDNSGDEYNLEAWLRDEVKYIPGKLFKEAHRRFNRRFTTFIDLAEFLVFEENVLGPEDVPTKLKRD